MRMCEPGFARSKRRRRRRTVRHRSCPSSCSRRKSGDIARRTVIPARAYALSAIAIRALPLAGGILPSRRRAGQSRGGQTAARGGRAAATSDRVFASRKSKPCNGTSIGKEDSTCPIANRAAHGLALRRRAEYPQPSASVGTMGLPLSGAGARAMGVARQVLAQGQDRSGTARRAPARHEA